MIIYSRDHTTASRGLHILERKVFTARGIVPKKSKNTTLATHYSSKVELFGLYEFCQLVCLYLLSNLTDEIIGV